MHQFTLLTSMVTMIVLSPSPLAASNVGKTIIATGQVNAFEQPQSSRKLKRRAPIYDVDTIQTQVKSRAQFRMNDGSLLALKENSTLLVSEYQYQSNGNNNSMVLDLVQGGLRSVTGAIKDNNGSYELKTPVGSIGIRGTHFEIELVDGDMFLAVWDGAIDLTLATSNTPVSFGPDESFSFGVVDSGGNVTPLLAPPENFQQGHSDEPDSQQANNQNTQNNQNNQNSNNQNGGQSQANPPAPQQPATTQPTPTPVVVVQEQAPAEELLNETITSTTPTSPEVVANMTGSFSFNNIENSTVNSSSGSATLTQLNMTVNFDDGLVSDGQLNATDSGGDWFAAFNGVIDENQLALGVNFATHGNELASGDISAIFTDNARKLSGEFSLFEIANPGNTINGSYLLKYE